MTQLEAQVFTILIELSGVFLIRLSSKSLKEVNIGRVLLACVAVNFITHPIAWNTFQWLLDRSSYWTAFSIIEIGVVLAEGELYKQMLHSPRKLTYLTSFFANALSAFSNIVF